jgi:serine protease AprX
VLDKAGGGSIDQMLAGIFWVLDNRERYGIRILNISVSIEAQTDPAKSIRLLKAVEEAQKKGILVVVAAGNRGPGARSISPLGRGDHVLTVGCHDKDYRVPGVISCETYSGRGPGSRQMKKPDLVAPGTNITSTSARCKRQNGRIVHAYEPRSGTSFAAPLVSGAAALLWEKDPALSSEEIKHRLCITAQDLNEPWNKQGWGMLDIGRALTRT